MSAGDMAIASRGSGRRYRLDWGTGETVLHLPVRRDIFSIIIALLIFAFALFGEMFAIVMMNAGGEGTWFLPIWLAIWSLGLLAFFFNFLWKAFGHEKWIATNQGLKHVRSILFLPMTSEFPAARIEGLEYLPDDFSRRVTVNGRIIPQPAVGFFYDDRPVRLAHGITEAAAREIINAFSMRLTAVNKRRRG